MENPILPGEIPQISAGFSSAIHRWPVPLSAALTFTMPLASMSKVTSILPRERHVNATWTPLVVLEDFTHFVYDYYVFIVLVYTIIIQYIYIYYYLQI